MRRSTKKSKVKKIVLWVTGSLVVLLIVSLFAINYAIDKVLGSLSGLDSINSEGTEHTEDVERESIDPDPADSDKASSNAAEQTRKDSTGTDSSSTVSSDYSEQSAAPAQEDQPESRNTGYTAEISTDKAKDIEENATISEKASVVSVMMKNLSASDISQLKDLADGGLSLEEKREARSIILEKLSEEEYNKLIKIAHKYGVSQGHTYDEVKKEEEAAPNSAEPKE